MDFGNTLIIGDSYSAFEGWVGGNRTYYPTDGSVGSDVGCAEMMWWNGLLSENGGRLLRNDSWAGAPICYTGYNGSCAEATSFVGRLGKLQKDGFFDKNRVDTVFVFGGTNDSWANAPLGEIKYGSLDRKDLFSVFPATCRLLSMIKQAAPEAEIVFIINTELREGIAEGFARICGHYGARAVRLADIDKHQGHPTAAGMQQIARQILSALVKAEK